MGALIDLTGQRFTRLIVLSRNKNAHKWVCKCDCGEIKMVNGSDLKYGKVKSCGCYNKDISKQRATKHGCSNKRIYQTYNNMIRRCYDTGVSKYINYGAKGIEVCDEWRGSNGFINFLNWSLSTGYTDNLTIERKDINKNYCPENCTWIPLREQAINRSTTHWIEYLGEKKNITQWAQTIGISREKLKYLMAKNGEQETLKELLKED